MKANNGSGNNELRDNWESPKWLFNILDLQYKFSFDCCASDKNSKCLGYSDNFLHLINFIPEMAWMNPPFSKAESMFKHFFKVIKKGVAIYRCDNFETKIWQHIIFPKASWIFIPNKRINYEGLNKSGSRFPSALIGIGVDIPKGLFGVILKVNKYIKI